MILIVDKNCEKNLKKDFDVTISLWQRSSSISRTYLCFRWAVFLIFLFIITCSLADVWSERMETCNGVFLLKWPIYLTRWTMITCVLQAAVAAVLTSLAYAKKKRDFFLKIYNPIYAIAMTFGCFMWVWWFKSKSEIK